MGLDDPSGPIYAFWSGIAGQFDRLALIAVVWRHVNCHDRRCMRVAIHHHPETGFRACRKHIK
jgi:hypothetical protein